MISPAEREKLRKELERIEKEQFELQLREQERNDAEIVSLIEEHNYQEAYESSYGFLTHSWKTFEPSNFIPAKHLHAIGEHLDACLRGEIKNLIVNIPPRCSKSSLITKAFPAYVWVKDPGKRIINISYSKRLAVGDSLISRQIIDSQWYQHGLNTVWKEVNDWESVWELSKSQNTKEDYRNTSDGRRFATSTGGTLTGVGGNLIIIDDPLDPEMAHSKIERENCNEWSSQTLPSRLDDKVNGVMILVQQRLHEEDLTGYFLDQGIWEHLYIPMEFEESRRFWTKIGWTDWRVKDKELMDNDRHPREVVEELKLKMGEYGYSGQYQQNPVPLGGGLIKENWWKTWYILPSYFDSTCMVFDLSFKGDVTSDNNALIVIGRKDNKFYVIDLVYGKMDIVGQLDAIKTLVEKYPYVRSKLVEDKANGSAAWSLLNRTVTGLNKVDPKGIAKDVRIMSMIPEINAGNIFLPDPDVHPWIKPLLSEAKMFPKGKNDDALDALSYSIDYLVGSNNFTRMPTEVVTETPEVVQRQDIRQYFQEAKHYNTPVQISRNYVQGLFN
ncbi:phage terminase large subunit [Scytonema sp. NUACC26]|uniref:phage terminase large subunit n=1 Tax=Scytonema sp. NUACC26 TaxID=3140176 RepID=UPI0034DBB978